MAVSLILLAVGYVVGRMHSTCLRWAALRRARESGLVIELPRATTRRTRYDRVLHSLDARDRATWSNSGDSP